MPEDYYEALGVTKDASKEDIQKSYRKLAMEHHPDRGGNSEKFREISEAYGVLSNDQKRAEYDNIGKSGIRGRYSEEDIFSGSDLEGMLRGMGFSGFGIHEMFRENRRVLRAKGNDIHGIIELSLEEVLNGATKKVKYNREVVCKECSGVGAKKGDYAECATCGGEGNIKYAQRTLFGMGIVAQECNSCSGHGKIISRYCHSCSGEGVVNKTIEDNIKIDAGVKDGITYSKNGAGNEAPNGDSGDFYIDINVREHPIYKRKDDDLIAEKVINFSYAALGGKVEMDYFSKKMRIDIPPGTQSGTYLRIKGKGLPHFRSSDSGDLMIKVNVKTPENLKERQKALFEELRKYE